MNDSTLDDASGWNDSDLSGNGSSATWAGVDVSDGGAGDPLVHRLAWWQSTIWSVIFGILILVAVAGNLIVIWIVLGTWPFQSITYCAAPPDRIRRAAAPNSQTPISSISIDLVAPSPSVRWTVWCRHLRLYRRSRRIRCGNLYRTLIEVSRPRLPSLGVRYVLNWSTGHRRTWDPFAAIRNEENLFRTYHVLTHVLIVIRPRIRPIELFAMTLDHRFRRWEESGSQPVFNRRTSRGWRNGTNNPTMRPTLLPTSVVAQRDRLRRSSASLRVAPTINCRISQLGLVPIGPISGSDQAWIRAYLISRLVLACEVRHNSSCSRAEGKVHDNGEKKMRPTAGRIPEALGALQRLSPGADRCNSPTIILLADCFLKLIASVAADRILESPPPHPHPWHPRNELQTKALLATAIRFPGSESNRIRFHCSFFCGTPAEGASSRYDSLVAMNS